MPSFTRHSYSEERVCTDDRRDTIHLQLVRDHVQSPGNCKGTTKEKQLVINIMVLRQWYERQEIYEVRWINGIDNPVSATTYKGLMTFMRMDRRSGTSLLFQSVALGYIQAELASRLRKTGIQLPWFNVETYVLAVFVMMCVHEQFRVGTSLSVAMRSVLSRRVHQSTCTSCPCKFGVLTVLHGSPGVSAKMEFDI